jgi:hypothetical protein
MLIFVALIQKNVELKQKKYGTVKRVFMDREFPLGVCVGIHGCD